MFIELLRRFEATRAELRDRSQVQARPDPQPKLELQHQPQPLAPTTAVASVVDTGLRIGELDGCNEVKPRVHASVSFRALPAAAVTGHSVSCSQASKSPQTHHQTESCPLVVRRSLLRFL